MGDIPDGKPRIEFTFAVTKTMTLADGTPRIQIDLPEGQMMQYAMFAECHAAGVYLKGMAWVAQPAEAEVEKGENVHGPVIRTKSKKRKRAGGSSV